MNLTSTIRGYISFVKWKNILPVEKQINSTVSMVFSHENTPNGKNTVLEYEVTPTLSFVDLMSYDINHTLLDISVQEKGKTEYDNTLYEIISVTPVQEELTVPPTNYLPEKEGKLELGKRVRAPHYLLASLEADMADLATILGLKSSSELVERHFIPIVNTYRDERDMYRISMKGLKEQASVKTESLKSKLLLQEPKLKTHVVS
jgi:hypothetical protein